METGRGPYGPWLLVLFFYWEAIKGAAKKLQHQEKSTLQGFGWLALQRGIFCFFFLIDQKGIGNKGDCFQEESDMGSVLKFIAGPSRRGSQKGDVVFLLN